MEISRNLEIENRVKLKNDNYTETDIYSSDIIDCKGFKIKDAIRANKKMFGDLDLFQTYTLMLNCKVNTNYADLL